MGWNSVGCKVYFNILVTTVHINDIQFLGAMCIATFWLPPGSDIQFLPFPFPSPLLDVLYFPSLVTLPK